MRIARMLALPLVCLPLQLARWSDACAAMGTAGGTVTKTMIAGPYKLTLDITPLQRMYTMAQFKKTHPKDGEIMVSGSMAMGGTGMHAAMPNHHLELHVYDAKTGKTITQAMVAITIRDAMGRLVEKLPIAVMYGIKEGVADTHFGNNVSLKKGSYAVATQVNMTAATFKVTIGKAAGGMSM